LWLRVEAPGALHRRFAVTSPAAGRRGLQVATEKDGNMVVETFEVFLRGWW
jgi:hypothetical protein